MSGAPARRAARAFVSFGSNLGAREEAIAGALLALREVPATELVACSPVYETVAEGPGAQGPYLNGVVELSTRLAPRALLAELLRIEARAGRERGRQRNRARTLDLDLLLYGRLRLRKPGLELPHPRLVERPFVLEPLRDLAPALHPPGTELSVAELAARVRDPRRVWRWRGTIPDPSLRTGRLPAEKSQPDRAPARSGDPR